MLTCFCDYSSLHKLTIMATLNMIQTPKDAQSFVPLHCVIEASSYRQVGGSVSVSGG